MTDQHQVTLKEFFKEQIDLLRRDIELFREITVTKAEHDTTTKHLERSIERLEKRQGELDSKIDARSDKAFAGIDASTAKLVGVVGVVVALIQVVLLLV